MTEIELCESIADFVVQQLKQMSWEDSSGSMSQREPKTFIGFVPPKRATQADDFPYVLVVPTNGSTSSDSDQSTSVDIFVGARSESISGWSYLFGALERIRHSFMTAQGHVISHNGRTFRMRFPFSWAYTMEQPFPFWEIKISTSWDMPVVQQEDPDSLL